MALVHGGIHEDATKGRTRGRATPGYIGCSGEVGARLIAIWIGVVRLRRIRYG